MFTFLTVLFFFTGIYGAFWVGVAGGPTAFAEGKDKYSELYKKLDKQMDKAIIMTFFSVAGFVVSFVFAIKG